MYTGASPLRSGKFSKIHIKSNIEATQKKTPDLKRSRAREFEKNEKKSLNPLESIEIVFFLFSDLLNDLLGVAFKVGIRFRLSISVFKN